MMKPEVLQLEAFYVMGITVRTTNQGGRSSGDIGALWKRFHEQRVAALIPGKVSDEVYCVYTDYESGAGGSYTTLLGYRVHAPADIPELAGMRIQGSRYYLFQGVGALPESVIRIWNHIWQSDIDRKFAADFDIYPASAEDGTTVRTYLSIA